MYKICDFIDYFWGDKCLQYCITIIPIYSAFVKEMKEQKKKK